MAENGRPSDYTDALAEEICRRVAEGDALHKICKEANFPSGTTVYNWFKSNPGFLEKYALAREERADKIAEEILEIADDGKNDTYRDSDGNVVVDHDVLGRSKLRIDARKWAAGKMAPKKYGDKVAIGGADDLPPVNHTHKLTPALKSKLDKIIDEQY